MIWSLTFFEMLIQFDMTRFYPAHDEICAGQLVNIHCLIAKQRQTFCAFCAQINFSCGHAPLCDCISRNSWTCLGILFIEKVHCVQRSLQSQILHEVGDIKNYFCWGQNNYFS